MNKILTFDTYEDEAYNQMLVQYQEKEMKKIIEIYAREERLRKDNTSCKPSSLRTLGTDLELACLVRLGYEKTTCKGYYYDPQGYYLPTSMRVRGFQSIQTLVNGVQEMTQDMDKTRFYGAKINPVFYTFTNLSGYLPQGLAEKERKEFERLYWKEK